VCEERDRSEGGGNRESTAIAGAACNNRASKDRMRAGGLKSQTSPAPCEGGLGALRGWVQPCLHGGDIVPKLS